MALNSENEIIYFPTGTYEITDSLIQNTGKVKKLISEKDVVFSVKFLSSKKLFKFNKNVEINNIIFDFNNGPVSRGLDYFVENLGLIKLTNLSFKNVYDKNNNNQIGTQFISIATQGNPVDINNITFNNILKLGNTTQGDASGNITGIYYADLNTIAQPVGSIKNISTTEMHNVNSSGNIIYEDVATVQIYSQYEGTNGKLLIENIKGYNFGKRLIKQYASNVHLEGIDGYSNTHDSLSVLGISSKRNVTLNNFKARGNMSYALAIDTDGTIATKIDIDIQKPVMTGNPTQAWAIFVSANNVEINDFILSGSECITIGGYDKQIQNTIIKNGTYTIKAWANRFIGIYGEYGFKNLALENIFGINNSTIADLNPFIEILKGKIAAYDGILINNCGMECNPGTDNSSFVLENINNITIKDFSYKTFGVGYQCGRFIGCKNISILNLLCEGKIKTALFFQNCETVKVNNLTSSLSNTSVALYNSINNILKNIDTNTLYINDQISKDSTTIESISELQKKTVNFIYEDKILKNPYRGPMHYGSGSTNDYDFTLVAAYVTWRDLEPTRLSFNWSSFETKFKFSKWRTEGKKMMIMFMMDWPTGVPLHLDIPDWLYTKINKEGTYYSNGGSGGGFSPNYKNAILISEHTRVIKAFADRYNNDDFIWLFKMGSVGHWGEMHTCYLKNEEGALPSVEYTSQYEQAYATYLSKKYISIRLPRQVGLDNNMGLHCDGFGNAYSDNYYLDAIANGYHFYLNNSTYPSMPNAWKTAPMGGECYGYDPDYFTNVTYPELRDTVIKSHCTWFRIPEAGQFTPNSESDINLRKMLNQIGYKFYLKSITYPTILIKEIIENISMTWNNAGIAPFYYDWKVAIALFNNGDELVYIEKANFDIRKWLPGDSIETLTIKIPLNIPIGTYNLRVGIINPKTEEPEIELAIKNEKENLWYPIGDIQIKD